MTFLGFFQFLLRFSNYFYQKQWFRLGFSNFSMFFNVLGFQIGPKPLKHWKIGKLKGKLEKIGKNWKNLSEIVVSWILLVLLRFFNDFWWNHMFRFGFSMFFNKYISFALVFLWCSMKWRVLYKFFNVFLYS